MELRQGNTYSLKVNLKVDGQPIDYTNVDTVELTFGAIKKKYCGDEINVSENMLIVDFTQEDTMSLNETVEYQIRVKYKNESVISTDINTANIKECLSETIL